MTNSEEHTTELVTIVADTIPLNREQLRTVSETATRAAREWFEADEDTGENTIRKIRTRHDQHAGNRAGSAGATRFRTTITSETAIPESDLHEVARDIETLVTKALDDTVDEALMQEHPPPVEVRFRQDSDGNWMEES